MLPPTARVGIERLWNVLRCARREPSDRLRQPAITRPGSRLIPSRFPPPQIELWTNPGKYEKKVYTLPKRLDEKVARLHLDKIGARLTKLSQKQSTYISVPIEGPFKPDHYRY
jgi:hypothetical protein